MPLKRMLIPNVDLGLLWDSCRKIFDLVESLKGEVSNLKGWRKLKSNYRKLKAQYRSTMFQDI